MKRSLQLGNPSLFALLTSAIAACGASGTVLESMPDGGSDAGSDAGSGPADIADAQPCCPPDKTTSNSSMYLGGQKRGDCAKTSDLGCAFHWHLDTELSFDSLDGAPACDLWRFDVRNPLAGETRYCVADPSLDGGCAPGFAPDGDGGCTPPPPTPRRPFLVGSSMRTAAARSGGDWSRVLPPLESRPNEITSELLAAYWLKDALEEHASVAAFARFSMLLLSVSAPPELVISSQRASLDEVHHARACFALAERHGGRAHGPASLTVHDSLGKMSLAEIAALTAEEGCVGETLGAALAAEQLAVATDPATLAILRKIAVDESRHAELAWRFVTWAIVTGGAEVERAVVRAVEGAITVTLEAKMRTYDGLDLDAWHTHGRLTCHEARAVAIRTIEDVVRPCLAQVVGSRHEARNSSFARTA